MCWRNWPILMYLTNNIKLYAFLRDSHISRRETLLTQMLKCSAGRRCVEDRAGILYDGLARSSEELWSAVAVYDFKYCS